MDTKTLTVATAMPRLKVLLAAGTMLGAIGLFSAANANLTITPGNGSSSGVHALAETAADGGPGFPLSLFGYTNGATLNAIAGESYLFTFEGAGDAANTNSFTVNVGGFPVWTFSGGTPTPFTSIPSFTWTATSTGAIPFTFTSKNSAGAQVCSISDGAAPNPNGGLPCSYLVALGNSTTSPGATGPNATAWIGFSDTETIQAAGVPQVADFQDGVIKVSELPEPTTIGLFSIALAGLTGLRRKRQRV